MQEACTKVRHHDVNAARVSSAHLEAGQHSLHVVVDLVGALALGLEMRPHVVDLLLQIVFIEPRHDHRVAR